MRLLNFSAGPACLPEAVLAQVQKELLCYRDTGVSVMEMSHRSAEFKDIIDRAQNSLRQLMGIGEDYAVLFLQGGASMQFTMIPQNLMNTYHRAYYISTGSWSKKAIAEAKKSGEAVVAASSEEKTFTYIPKLDAGLFGGDADYVHITQNNTIYGTRYTKLPETGGIPIVADISSYILSEEMDVSQYGMLYAGAQKNIGPAGLTVVIIRKDLVGNAPENTPTMLNYKTHVDAGSLFNTPPTFAVYTAGLVFEHLLANGGIAAMQTVNEKKAKLLYDYLDKSEMFSNPVAKEDRSLMNVPFVTGDPALDARFIAEARESGIVGIKGHKSVGGMRASIYNAMPIEGVEKLIDFMTEFERKA